MNNKAYGPVVPAGVEARLSQIGFWFYVWVERNSKTASFINVVGEQYDLFD